LSVHDVSCAIDTLAGAPNFGGNVSVHGPVIVASVVSVVPDLPDTGDTFAFLKTTNTDSRSSRSSGTTVKLGSPAYSAGCSPGCRLPARCSMRAPAVNIASRPDLPPTILPPI